MLIPRFFPVLLIKNKRLINTINFTESRYLGDPLNALRIFNEKLVDEVVIYDISSGPLQLDYLSALSAACRMPVTYGGRISSVEDALSLINLGFEKVSVSDLFFHNPNLLKEIVDVIGMQSLALTLNIDFSKFKRSYFCFSWSDPKLKMPLSQALKKLSTLRIGEVIFNCRHNDGLRCGYDQRLLAYIDSNVCSSLVMSIVGGCSTPNDFEKTQKEFPRFSYGATSFFVYKGNLDAVLISYNHPLRPNDF